MTAKEEAARLLTLPPDEPLFVLRAQDLFAPDIVTAWAEVAALRGVPEAKIEEAMKVVKAMKD